MPLLKIITGPMYAGKTTALIDAKRHIEATCVTCSLLMLNHTLDDRYALGDFITTHTKDTEICIKTNNLARVLDTVLFNNATHIFIDEAQFFEPKDLVNFVIECLFVKSKNVIVAGLNSSINMGDIGGLHLLFKYADEISVLRGDCFFCDNNSCSNILEGKSYKSFSGDGGLDMTKIKEYGFKPVCRGCWFEKSNIFSRN